MARKISPSVKQEKQKVKRRVKHAKKSFLARLKFW